MNLDTLINFLLAFPFLTLSQFPWQMLLADLWMYLRAWLHGVVKRPGARQTPGVP